VGRSGAWKSMSSGLSLGKAIRIYDEIVAVDGVRA
jgi:hypothetical protein